MRALPLLCVAGLSLMTVGTYAATYRVDDRATMVSQPVASMKWRQLAPGRLADNSVDSSVLVAVKLNVSPWIGKSGSIYMTLAPIQPPVQVSWRTQGRFIAGSLTPGSRTLVYSGVIGTPQLEETMTVLLSADGRTLVNTQSLQFGFEIDVLP